MESFENIHLDLSKKPGRCRFAETGFAWKPSDGGDTSTFNRDTVAQASWSRASRGYELKTFSPPSGPNRTPVIHQFDGFQSEDFDRLAKLFKTWYGIVLEQRERALRGWNWGKSEFGKVELLFNVQNRPAFEIPYSDISNTNLAGKNEVAVDFSLYDENGNAKANGTVDGSNAGRQKKGAPRDELVEARFYIPGTAVKKEQADEQQEEDQASGEEKDDAEEQQNAANLWYETLMEKAEVGHVTGNNIATFGEVLHLTPRGRFDIDMYENSFRLRGKTYDYKIPYDNIKKFFVLPKPDDVHYLVTIGLDPPLRQGQTRYPFVVMQYKRDEDSEIELNMSEEDLKGKYEGKLQNQYSGPTYHVLTNLFRGLAGKKVITPSKDFSSRHQQSAVKCSIKANEGHLFCMDKSLLFVPKPATYIQLDHVQMITMSRVGGAVSASRTFDITVTLKGGQPDHQFSNINREEQQPLEDYFKARNLKVRNEMAEDAGLLAAALKEQGGDSSDDEVVQADRGSADEDSEEDDEDFKADDESDVAEEFDSGHESSGGGSGSDAEMKDADDDDEANSDTAEKVERPKKKQKKAS